MANFAAWPILHHVGAAFLFFRVLALVRPAGAGGWPSYPQFLSFPRAFDESNFPPQE